MRFLQFVALPGALTEYPAHPVNGTRTNQPVNSIASLSNLRDPAAIQEQLRRIQRAINDDPALAVGSAKELIESAVKVVLIERGQAVDDEADLSLVEGAQQALALHPSSKTPGPDGTDAVKKDPRWAGGPQSSARSSGRQRCS